MYDSDYPFGIFKFLTLVVIIIRTSMRDRLQWQKFEDTKGVNEKPYIVEGQTTMAKGLKIPKE
jgi:hypothetical protein